MSAELPKLITIVGTNASGKSMLGVDLAELFDGEVVSADSRQVYRELDIGTGKLAPYEMRGIPHHLIDIVGLDATFSLADYQRHAHAAIDDILLRGRTPFLVGGTGLYVRAITRGYRLIDVAPNPSLREELEAQDSTTLWSQLASVDPTAASLIDHRNKRRVIRALELYADGQYYSEQNDSISRYSALQLGLTWPADVLRERIHTRLVRRIGEGMIEETAKLLEAGVSREKLNSLGLEYRHLLRYIEGDYATEDELVCRLSAHIYRFSRKQMLWFRGDTDIHWLNSSGDYYTEAANLIHDHLKS